MSQCPYANVLNPDFYVHGMPYGELQKLREAGPVVRVEDERTGVPYWLVTRREELDFVSRHPELFSSAARGPFPEENPPEIVEGIFHNFLIGMDPPLHMKMRRVVRDAFTPAAVARYEPYLRERARAIVDAVASKGECEFITEVAAELPLFAILELLGVPSEDRKQFFDWTNTMTFADDPDMQVSEEEGQVAAAEVINYAMQLVAKGEGNRGVVVEALLNGEIDGRPVSQEEFGWMFLLVMVGGNESTRTAIAHGMRLLMENPDQLQYLQENPNRIPEATEEMLRYNTAFIAMRRTVTEDLELAGQPLKKGDKVVLHYHTVNHDEQVFGDDATRFDVKRMQRMPDLPKQLRSFGIGEHFCLGSHLARLEMRIMFEEIIPKLRNPKLAGEIQYVRSFFVNTIKEMPVRFDPVEKSA